MSERPKRRWFQFSLGTLLVVLALLCIGPGGYVAFEQNKARKQKAAVKAIERISGTVQYDKSMPVRSAAVRQVLGDETFGNVNLVQLNNAKVTDADLEHLSELEHLEYLWLDDTHVTDAGLVHLAGLKGLKLLILDNTDVDGHGLVHLSGLKRLTKLSLRRTQVNDEGLRSLAGMTNLEELWLEDTPVSDAGLAHLADLRALTYLSLGRTQVSDAGLVHLANLKNLKTLYLPSEVSLISRWKLQGALPNCHISSSGY